MPGTHPMFEENKERPRAHVTGQQGSGGGQREDATNPKDEVDNIPGSIKEHSGWDVYNNEAKKVDAELVKDWTDSLNFLLLFAAIFSAVLTAFIIESKKLLELDPTTVMVDVMIFYTNNLANGGNQLSISQDSGRRLMLLVGEMRNLQLELMPTFDVTEASWYSILDLAGWTYLRSHRAEEVTAQDRNIMEAFLQCYAIPAVQNLVAPTADMDYTTEIEQKEYWSQYCDAVGGGGWDINRSRPNYLFLLLRDIPYPSLLSTQEMEIAIRVSHWRNSRCKRWDSATIIGWIEQAARLPYIMKVLQVIAVAQAADPNVGPLWRTTVPNHVNNPHFAEVLKIFDGLMGPNCHLLITDYLLI